MHPAKRADFVLFILLPPLEQHFSISTPPGRIRNLDEQGVLVSALPFNTLDQFWEMVEVRLSDRALEASTSS